MPKTTRAARAPQSLYGELLFDEAVQMITNHRMIEALDHFVEESGDEEALGDFYGNAAGAQIEELVIIDLPGRCAVGATDVIGQNFETWH